MTPEQVNLKIAVSSRALFNMDESNAIYEKEGVAAYADYQLNHEQDPLPEGMAFALVRKLEALNTDPNTHVSILLMSRNSADTGLRILNSIEHYQLNITRATFTNGAPPFPYLKAFNAHLFLSGNELDVRDALAHQCPAARILKAHTPSSTDQLRIAFDGDAVLFSDESEKIYQARGLKAFAAHEKAQAHTQLQSGPFKSFLEALCRIQQINPYPQCPIRTALVTARSAPAHERVIRTLRGWGIRLDEALFLGGLDKGAFLNAFGADIFFDDQTQHCDSASQYVTTAHVPHGLMNDIVD